MSIAQKQMPLSPTGITVRRLVTISSPMAYRVSIATVTVLGIGTLVGGTVALALYLGLSSATDNTRSLLAEQVDDFIDSVAQRISDRLEPVLAQASWIAERVESGVIELNDTQSLDPFIVGALSATPQVTGIAIVHPDGHSRRWGREGPEIIEEDWSNRPEIMDWLAVGAVATAPAWRESRFGPTHSRPMSCCTTSRCAVAVAF